MARKQQTQSVREEPKTPEQPRYVVDRTDECRSHRTRGGVANLMSLVGGTALGAAIMYLFDPEAGRERREHLGETTGHAVHEAGEALGSTWDTVSTRASGAARALAGRAQEMTEDAADTASDWGDRARRKGRKVASNWLDTARDYVPSFHRESSVPTAAAIGASALGCLAIGAGAMYLFDPTRGPERRRRLGRQVNDTVSEMGRLARATGEHLGMRSWMNRGSEFEMTGEERSYNASVASNFCDVGPSSASDTGTGAMPASTPMSENNATGGPVSRSI
jgi:gas vesicle protein